MALGPLCKLVDAILSQPAWWDPTNKALPAIQTIKGKQSIPGSDLHQFLQALSWSTTAFIDRALAMLIVFAGGVQFSTGRVPVGDHAGDGQLKQWTDLICRITPGRALSSHVERFWADLMPSQWTMRKSARLAR